MLKSYLLIAVKVLMRRKLFTAISLFGITFTLMVLVVCAAIFEQVFVAHPPEVHADRTLGVYRLEGEGNNHSIITEPGYYLLDRHVRTLPGVERVSIFSLVYPVVSYHQGNRIESALRRTDGEYWQILEYRFLEGRPFTPEEERSASFVAVINQTTREHFFGQETAAGRTIEVAGQHFRVVGVVEDVSRLREVPFADIWVPHSTAKNDSYRYQPYGGFGALILARSRNDLAQIKAEVAARFAAAELPAGDVIEHVASRAETYTEHLAARNLGEYGARPSTSKVPILCLKAISLVLLFMLLPAINLVNLNVSRIIERSSEIGVRKAFGASSRILIGQLLVENIVLTLIGGLLALIVSAAALELINRSGVIAYVHLTIEPTVLGSGVVMAVIFGLLSGSYPAWKMSRLDPARALSGRSS
jgi:putative ABC transport system permease protein